MLEKHTGEPEDIPEEFFKQEQKKRKRKVESCEETAEIAGTDSKRKKFAKEEKPKEDQVSEDSHVSLSFYLENLLNGFSCLGLIIVMLVLWLEVRVVFSQRE